MYSYCSFPTLTNCTFSGNSADKGGAIYHDLSTLAAANCTFSGNRASTDCGGIYVFSYNVTVTNCILWGNSDSSGVNESAQISGPGGSLFVNYNCIQGWTGTLGGTGNTGSDPMLVREPNDGGDGWGVGDNDDFGDLDVLEVSPCIDAGDNSALPQDIADLDDDNNFTEPTSLDLDGGQRFVDNPFITDTGSGTPPIVDMGAYEYRIIFVRYDHNGANDGSSWADGYSYLQDALSSAEPGDQMWVAGGTYKPDQGVGKTPGDRAASFHLVNRARFYGGFSRTETSLAQRDWKLNETILSGDIGTVGDDSDNSYHIVRASGTDATTVLDGFSVTGGMANQLMSPHIAGGGMWNDSASPTVANCTFSKNTAMFYGGGMCNANNSSPTVTSCTFNGDLASKGGGMYNEDNSTPTVTNCTFSGNRGTGAGGGLYNRESSPTVTNSVFCGNWSKTGGGGMYNDDGCNPTLANCTFASNSASKGGGVYNDDISSATLTNCILWGNTATISDPQIGVGGSSSITVTYCDVEGGWGGPPNIDADPCFVRDPCDGGDGWSDDPQTGGIDEGANDDFGNLRLSPGSPCIDAGDSSSVPADTADLDNDANTTEPIPFDLDSRPRIVSGDCNDTVIVDMGSYEFDWAYIGDFAGGCDVDFVDFTYLALTWLKEDGEPGYDYLCDISIPADNFINVSDLKIFTDNVTRLGLGFVHGLAGGMGI
jgi:predicted outer membrane repeat protein